MKKALMMLAVAAIVCFLGVSAYADPLTLHTVGLVGTWHNKLDGGNSYNDQIALAQAILNYDFNNVIGTKDYQGFEIKPGDVDYSGTLIFNDVNTHTNTASTASTIVVPGGWQYALVKYDGQNAGYVLFDLTAFGTSLPNYPYSLWGDNATQYAMSGYTLFNYVPDGGLTVMLLGFGVGGLALFSRKFKQ